MKQVRLSQFLSEAPLPDDWDDAMYNDKVPFARRVAYAKERAKRLGSGSSRVAFVIPYQGRDTVLKIAKNRKGMAQNDVEIQILDDHYAQSLGLFIPLIDYDEQNESPTWIHTELAKKATEADFVKACGGTLNDLLAYASEYHGKKVPYGDASKVNGESELAEAMMDYVGSYSPNIADYRNIKNWGVYNGSPVIIDAGYNDDVQQLYYPKQTVGARW